MAKIFSAFATKNLCYIAAQIMTPEGFVLHSTGANNPNLWRYVDKPDICGANKYNNHYNMAQPLGPTGQPGKRCPHGFIGLDKNGEIRIAQLLPWNYSCWGCGSGSKGSYNDNYIQIEICEDALTNEKYFNEVFRAAAELCAQLAERYKFPVDNIVSHKEAHALGYASNHGDVEHWTSRFGKDMNWFRDEVRELMKPAENSKPADKSYFVVGTKVCKGTAALTTAKNQLKALGYEYTVMTAE